MPGKLGSRKHVEVMKCWHAECASYHTLFIMWKEYPNLLVEEDSKLVPQGYLYPYMDCPNVCLAASCFEKSPKPVNVLKPRSMWIKNLQML